VGRSRTRDGDAVSACRSCGASVTWVVLPSGKRMPLDAVSTDDGTHVMSGAYAPGEPHAVPVDLLTPASTPRFKSHFATCPDSKEWRKPR
jgi:hypothetical protein